MRPNYLQNADVLEIFLLGVHFCRIFVAEGIFENGNLIVGLHGMTHRLLFGCVAQEMASAGDAPMEPG